MVVVLELVLELEFELEWKLKYTMMQTAKDNVHYLQLPTGT